jgi:Uma2 family endonuclease
MSVFAPSATEVVYPESDGKPMADNTRQYECIVTIQGNLDEMLPDFVGANNFWYPVERRPDINTAPDGYVAIDRPKGHRPSYKQWEEGGVAPQVVFEIVSPTNSGPVLLEKLSFYGQYGVEEYYIYDPDENVWEGYHRTAEGLRPINDMARWVSPRLGIRFDVTAAYMRILRPDGQEFKTFPEVMRLRREAEQRATTAEQRATTAEQRATTAEQRATTAEQQIEALKAKLRAAGIDPNGTAAP